MSRRPRPTDARQEEDEALAALREVYREVDARLASWSCDASTRCCRFGLTGREPYVTAVELLALRRALGRAGRKAPPGSADRRRLPALPAADERRCPLLGDDGRCSVYDDRPLGCRTFFCDRASPGEELRQRDLNALVARIRAISERLGPGAGEGRPLTRALARAR